MGKGQGAFKMILIGFILYWLHAPWWLWGIYAIEVIFNLWEMK
jgi:hypothetical protein